jgi:hypothetical protein
VHGGVCHRPADARHRLRFQDSAWPPHSGSASSKSNAYSYENSRKVRGPGNCGRVSARAAGVTADLVRSELGGDVGGVEFELLGPTEQHLGVQRQQRADLRTVRQ